MRHAALFLLSSILLVMTVGCSESVWVHSQPDGANVYLDGRHVGMTPAAIVVPRSQLKSSYDLELQKKGYEPYRGTLETGIAGGRATGALFTLGIVYLFKSPRYLVEPPSIPLLRSTSLADDTAPASAPGAFMATPVGSAGVDVTGSEGSAHEDSYWLRNRPRPSFGPADRNKGSNK